jgi:uncharacterized phage protein (TIGR01671 family)
VRELKFRAWDKKLNRMWTWEDIHEAEANGFITFLEMLEDKDRFVPLEYTGLKDKNGQEIYEGDVIKFSNGFYDDPYVVKFDEGCFEANRHGMFRRLNECEDIQVIGNIYQTPELLEVSK